MEKGENIFLRPNPQGLDSYNSLSMEGQKEIYAILLEKINRREREQEIDFEKGLDNLRSLRDYKDLPEEIKQGVNNFVLGRLVSENLIERILNFESDTRDKIIELRKKHDSLASEKK